MGRIASYPQPFWGSSDIVMVVSISARTRVGMGVSAVPAAARLRCDGNVPAERLLVSIVRAGSICALSFGVIFEASTCVPSPDPKDPYSTACLPLSTLL